MTDQLQGRARAIVNRLGGLSRWCLIGSCCWLTALVLGCKDEPSGNASDTGLLTDLRVGKRWAGFYQSFDDRGGVLNSGADTLSVVGMFAEGGEEWWRLSDGRTFTSRADGVYIKALADSVQPIRWYPYPVVSGYQEELRINGADPMGVVQLTVGATDTAIIVDGRRLPCIHYLHYVESIRHQVHYYISPGIGFVLMRSGGFNVPNASPGYIEWKIVDIPE